MNHLDNYFKYLSLELNVSVNTIEKYHQILSEFEQYCNIIGINIVDMNLVELKQYTLGLMDKHYSKSTQSQRISVLKSFYKYLLREEIIIHNPSSGLVYPKKDSMLPSVLYESELFNLFESIDIEKKYGKRNLALLTVLYSTGMRVSELENLTVNQFINKEKSIRVIGKGNKERVVPLNDYVNRIVEDYILLERDQLLKGNRADKLWINNKGTVLSSRGIRGIINRIVDNSELLIKVSPHTFRHSFASHLLNAGMDIRMVQELLGHESLNTTEIYTHLDDKALAEKYNKLNLRR